MSDPQFFARSAGLSLAELAKIAGAAEPPAQFAARRITGIAALDQAGPGDLVFCDNRRFVDELAMTRACACLVSPRFASAVPTAVAPLVVDKPYPAFVAASRALFPEALRPSNLFRDAKREGAHIDPAAHLEPDVQVGPAAVIGAGAEIGSGTVIGAGTVIGPQVRIGRNCSIAAGVTVTHALIGDGVIIHPGCRIGQDGFGYVMGPGGHTKIPQLGRVIIQDRVEIGANSTIDRGGLRDTVIGEGTKIDNLVQVGHNTSVGRHCVIIAQTGISGSVEIGDFAVLAARAGVYDHIKIGEGAQIAAQGVVWADVPPGARLGGWPVRPVRQWLREIATLEKLAGRSGEGPPRESER